MSYNIYQRNQAILAKIQELDSLLKIEEDNLLSFYERIDELNSKDLYPFDNEREYKIADAELQKDFVLGRIYDIEDRIFKFRKKIISCF